MRRSARALPIAVLISTIPGVAVADPSAADRVLATELFKAGRALMSEGRYIEACPKLAESQRLDPGGGTLLNLALCHEAEGKTASAWSEFTEARALARRDRRPGRERIAEQRIVALEPKLSRLTIVVAAEADLPDLVVRRDGSVVGRAALGSAIPIDPGVHEVDAAHEGRVPWKTTVVVGVDGDRQTVSVPVLALVEPPDAAVAPPRPVTVSPPASPPRKARSAERPAAYVGTPSEPPTGVNTLAYVVGGVGVAGFAIGGVFGVLTLTRGCDEGCDPDALASARTTADVSTAGFAVGVVGVGLAAYLLLTGDSDRPARSPRALIFRGAQWQGAHF